MSLVIDSSITLAWFFEDQRSAGADAVLRQVAESGAVAPTLWKLEVANGLQMAVRRKRIHGAFRDASMADLRALGVVIDARTDQQAWTTTLQLAERWRLTLYDASNSRSDSACRWQRSIRSCALQAPLLASACSATEAAKECYDRTHRTFRVHAPEGRKRACRPEHSADAASDVGRVSAPGRGAG